MMKTILNCLCFPFRYCCPCLQDSKSQTSKTQITKKTANTQKTFPTFKSDKTVESPKETKLGKPADRAVDEKKTEDVDLQPDPTEASTGRRRRKRLQWEKEGRVTSPKEIKDRHLTEEYVIPGDYPTKEACLLDQGFVLQNEILGQGAFAYVSKVTERRTGDTLACKEIKIGSMTRDGSMFRSLKNELFIMCKFQGHENLVRIIKHFIIKHDREQNEYCYIIMELASGNVLDMMLKDREAPRTYKRLPEPRAKDYFRQVSNGLWYLHDKKVAHKDLKLLNILVFRKKDRDIIKMTDFGLSRISYDTKKNKVIKARTFTGTVEYMSPQVLRLYINSEYGLTVETLREYDPYKADCWSLGVCLYCMITADIPFKSDRDPDQTVACYWRMKNKDINFTPNTRANYTSECLQMVNQLLEPDPAVRLTMDIVMRHRWLNS